MDWRGLRPRFYLARLQLSLCVRPQPATAMHLWCFPVSALTTLLLVRATGTAAKSSVNAPRAAAVQASAGADWLDVRFPILALNNSGCGGTDILPSGVRQRWYQWRVTADFADRNYPNNHFMGVYVFFGL